jgi:hypothetical protein
MVAALRTLLWRRPAARRLHSSACGASAAAASLSRNCSRLRSLKYGPQALATCAARWRHVSSSSTVCRRSASCSRLKASQLLVRDLGFRDVEALLEIG